MITQTKRLEFEQQLAQLKQAHQDGAITTDEYVEQARQLRFDDEAADQTWWLDPESETWYVAAIGSENFEEYTPPAKPQPPSDEPKPPQPEPIPIPPEPRGEPELQPDKLEMEFAPLTETQFDAQPEPSPSKTIAPIPINMVLIGAAVIIVIVILSGLGGIWLFLDNKQTPTPTAIAGQSTPTETIPAHPTDTPTSTPSPTSVPTATLTPTLLPTPSPTPTTTPTPTNTFSPLPVTDTPTPTFTPTPVLSEIEGPGLSGKLAYPEFDKEEETFVIKVVDLSTGQLIIQVPQASQPALSPDGTKLAYISWDPNQVGLYSLSLTNNSQNTISNSNYSQRSQWSFNSQAIVFEYIKEEQKDIRFSDADGVPGIQKGLTPAWLPDDRLVIQVCQDSSCGLAVVNTNGTSLKFLTNSTADISPAVSPDGKLVAYTSHDQKDNYDVWLINIDVGTPIRLTTSPNREGIPTWSPDGQWVAFTTEIGGQWSVQVIHQDGTGQQKLLDIPGGLGGAVASEAYRYRGWLHESISWAK